VSGGTSHFHGVLVLDKPPGLTSRDAVDRAMRWFPRDTRLGHTGTLDPLATGVLVLCVGAATRLTEYVQRMDKTYRAGLLLGARSDTDDADGTIEPLATAAPPDPDTVMRLLHDFIGEIEQVPPAYSAAKVSGRRSYELARQGREASLQPRRVCIHGIELLRYDYPWLELEVGCGKGTYIRSLARDLGERLGCGALVESLRRLRVGPFAVADALSLEADTALARARLLPVESAVVGMPRVNVSAADRARLRQGRSVPFASAPDVARLPAPSEEIAVFDLSHALVAVARVDNGKRLFRPVKVLAEDRTPHESC
jgi:tRNA pseudouridine55 synthase